jgi:hypothetical protein
VPDSVSHRPTPEISMLWAHEATGRERLTFHAKLTLDRRTHSISTPARLDPRNKTLTLRKATVGNDVHTQTQRSNCSQGGASQDGEVESRAGFAPQSRAGPCLASPPDSAINRSGYYAPLRHPQFVRRCTRGAKNKKHA